MQQTENIIYEQPLNEQIRICLQLEQLFQQVAHYIKDDSEWGSRSTLFSLLEIVSIIERPDLKTKLSKALSDQGVYLARLEQSPVVDSKKLKDLLIEVNRLVDGINAPGVKLAQTLRENEFLNNIRLQIHKPGGVSTFNLPNFQFWLLQPTEQRLRTLNQWLKDLELVHSAVKTVMELIRESTKSQIKFAKQGFFQETLDPNIPYQLIRIGLTPDRKVFPEVSVGRHRLSIHFVAPSFESRPGYITHDIQFRLAICV